MKQLRWIIILVAAAIALTVVFIVVDRSAQEKKHQSEVGKAKVLTAIDSTAVTRITLDNEEGHFAFDWDTTNAVWEVSSAERFKVNQTAIAAICNYVCDLKSVKTVAFNAQDKERYGFSDPVTVRVFTKETGMSETPYVIYVGDCTPTRDAYYAMVGTDPDIYTINYTSGSVFCVAKDTLKDKFIFDTYGINVSYYRQETEGMLPLELNRDKSGAWTMTLPSDFEVMRANADNLTEIIVRVTMERFIEEKPDDLAKYGLDKPWSKLWIRGTTGTGEAMTQEVWFGDPISNKDDETTIYGYLPELKQVFTILKANASFAKTDPTNYIFPYCVDVDIADLTKLEIDMGTYYPMHETLSLDYENGQYALGDKDIDALNDENILTLFQNYYRSISNLEFTALDLEAKPDGEAAMTITYTRTDGTALVLGFVPTSDKNNFYLMQDGSYTGMTVRLNKFTTGASVTPSYESLMAALK